MLIVLRIVRILFGLSFGFQVITMLPAIFMDLNGDLGARLFIKGIVAVISLAICIWASKGINKLQDEE